MQMEIFKERHTASIETINIKTDMLVKTIEQNEEKLNPLMVLSDLSKNCVSKYKSYLPSVNDTKSKMNHCVTTGKNKMSTVLYSPLYIRNNLDNYYTHHFEKNISDCYTSYHNLPLNYTICLTKVVSFRVFFIK